MCMMQCDTFYLAYEVLSDKEKRRVYDQSGQEGLNRLQQQGGQQHRDPFDLFSQ